MDPTEPAPWMHRAKAGAARQRMPGATSACLALEGSIARRREHAISDPGNGVFFLNSGSNGSMNVDHVVATGSPQGVRDDSMGTFTLVRGAGNAGW
jgi:hypothetical protein